MILRIKNYINLNCYINNVSWHAYFFRIFQTFISFFHSLSFFMFHIVDKIKNTTNYLHDKQKKTNKKEDLTLDLSNASF